ncbi:ribosome recycling factor domain-containing protein [Microdochium bolleyi]|uniref:Ribosome recycling factor domain-containing protein n=1 Tax=Microdochium bolleyi TaxID=196109 RepID=A0A136J2I0_9PEZI|nr:ribosome recycling factor domain-containing protein [Microdochium bolleyi]
MNSTRTARTVLQGSLLRCERAQLLNVRAPLQAIKGAAPFCHSSTTHTPSARPRQPSQQHVARSRGGGACRTIHSTSALSKKSREKNQVEDTKGGRGGGGNKNKGKQAAASTSSGAGEEDDTKGGPTANPADPLNFGDVKARHEKQSEHFVEKLKKFRAGGRFNPDVISSLPVVTDKATGESYPLRELGQVVPKGGRTISIILHEAGYVKPVMSAIQASADFNQQPQRDPDNELELVLKIEAEKPDDVAKRIKAICHDWRGRVKLIRQKRDKQHTAWRKDGLVTEDDKKLADKELEKVIKGLNAEIDNMEKETLKSAQV